MAGFIVLEDGRAYAASRWGFCRTVESIARALPEGKALAEWLLSDPIVQVYHNIDVRALTPANREMFLSAAESAYRTEEAQGAVDWSEPEFFDGWIKRFADLVEMIESVRRGEPPDVFNPHMNGTIPARLARHGPGW